MNLNEIKGLIERAKWFSRVGNYRPKSGEIALKSLAAWDNSVFGDSVNEQDAQIAEEMDWLPSSREEEDPIHGIHLINLLKDLEINYQDQVLDIYKTGLRSLKIVNERTLVSGANNFTQAAIGAALYCMRMASIEVIAGKQGFWCNLLNLYSEGYWPCGLLPQKNLVVY